MTLDEYNQFCASLKATTKVIQWGGSHVWKVGEKVFSIASIDKTTGQPAYTFKTSDVDFYFLSEQEGYRPAPYLASRGFKWIQQQDLATEKDEALEYYLTQSYKLVFSGLTKKRQAMILEEA